MTKGTHQQGKKTFEELNFKEQAQSINATRLNLRKMENAHKRRVREEGRVK